MVLPMTVNLEEHDCLGESLPDFLALILVCTLEIHGKVQHTTAVGNRNRDIDIAIALSLVNLSYDRKSLLNHRVDAALVCRLHILEEPVGECCRVCLVVELFVKVEVERKRPHYIFGKCVISHVLRLLCKYFRSVLHHIHYINLDSLTGKRIAPLAVNHLALRVHHIVIFQSSLTDAEVVFLNLLLRLLN